MIRVLFIINSARKRSALTLETLSLAQQSSKLKAIEIETDYAKHASIIAKSEASNYDVIVAVGGDGTFNEVVQGLIESEAEPPKLGLVPNGTGNDFMRMLPKFVPKDFVAAMERNKGNLIDIGMSEFQDQKRYFLNIADIGFGAKVVKILSKQRAMKLGGKISYSLAILRAFFSYKKNEVKLTADNFEFQGKVLMIAFCNGRIFGHGLTINPEAKLDNGRLNITIVGNVSLFTYIRKLGDLKKGNKIIHPEAHYFETNSVQISAVNSTEIWMEGDGELLGSGVEKVTVLPRRIELIS